MNWLKKLIDWVITAYADEEPQFRPKRVFIINGKTYYLRKRKRDITKK